MKREMLDPSEMTMQDLMSYKPCACNYSTRQGSFDQQTQMWINKCCNYYGWSVSPERQMWRDELTRRIDAAPAAITPAPTERSE